MCDVCICLPQAEWGFAVFVEVSLRFSVYYLAQITTFKIEIRMRKIILPSNKVRIIMLPCGWWGNSPAKPEIKVSKLRLIKLHHVLVCIVWYISIYINITFMFMFPSFKSHTWSLSCINPPPAHWAIHTGPISPLFSHPFCLCLCILKAAQSCCSPTPQLTIWSFWEPLNQLGCSICIRWWLREKYEDLLGTRVHSDWQIRNETNDRKHVLSMSHVSKTLIRNGYLGNQLTTSYAANDLHWFYTEINII